MIGYDAATSIARRALSSGRSVTNLVLESGLLNANDLDEILRPSAWRTRKPIPREPSSISRRQSVTNVLSPYIDSAAAGTVINNGLSNPR